MSGISRFRAAGSLAVLLAIIGPLPASAADIHIDPSRSEGCPGRGSLEAPYCGWREAGPLVGGNSYLQRRGTTWNGMVMITATPGLSAAALQGEVFIGAYGEDVAKPVIRVDNLLPDARDPASWRPAGPGLWAYRTAGFKFPSPGVLLLDGRRAFGPAGERGDLCTRRGPQRVEWLHAGEELLLCSPQGNPAGVFGRISGMQARHGEPWAPVYIEGRQHVVIDGLALEGGGWGAVEIRAGSADIEIRNCEIGRDSGDGVRVFDDTGMVSRIDVHHNRIDSGVRWGAVGYAAVSSGEGVYFQAGVQDSRIHHNEIIAWTHNGIYLNAAYPGSPGVVGNRIEYNDIHCGPDSAYFDYCRPFGIDGWRSGAASGNVFFANRLHDSSVYAQVNGDRNQVIGNFCYRMSNSGARRYPTGGCFSMQAYVFSRENFIAFNTLAYTADAAVQFLPGKDGITADHQVIGNIFHGCGHDAIPERRDVCIAVEPAPAVGPQVIRDNLLFNPGGRPIRVLYRGWRARDVRQWRAQAGDQLANNTVADPLFVNPQASDFSLGADSPALHPAWDQPPVLEMPGLAAVPVAQGAWQPDEAVWPKAR